MVRCARWNKMERFCDSFQEVLVLVVPKSLLRSPGIGLVPPQAHLVQRIKPWIIWIRCPGGGTLDTWMWLEVPRERCGASALGSYFYISV